MNLRRILETPNFTLGVFLQDEKIVCFSIELPFLDNKRNISCIPKGEYELIILSSKKRGYHYFLPKVAGRSSILMHTGNSTKDTQGCILPVTNVSIENGNLVGYESRKALDKIISLKPKTLKIV